MSNACTKGGARAGSFRNCTMGNFSEFPFRHLCSPSFLFAPSVHGGTSIFFSRNATSFQPVLMISWVLYLSHPFRSQWQTVFFLKIAVFIQIYLNNWIWGWACFTVLSAFYHPSITFLIFITFEENILKHIGFEVLFEIHALYSRHSSCCKTTDVISLRADLSCESAEFELFRLAVRLFRTVSKTIHRNSDYPA